MIIMSGSAVYIMIDKNHIILNCSGINFPSNLISSFNLYTSKISTEFIILKVCSTC